MQRGKLTSTPGLFMEPQEQRARKAIFTQMWDFNLVAYSVSSPRARMYEVHTLEQPGLEAVYRWHPMHWYRRRDDMVVIFSGKDLDGRCTGSRVYLPTRAKQHQPSHQNCQHQMSHAAVTPGVE